MEKSCCVKGLKRVQRAMTSFTTQGHQSQPQICFGKRSPTYSHPQAAWKTPEKSAFQLETSTPNVPLVPLLDSVKNTCHCGKQQDGTRSISHTYTTQLDNLLSSSAPLAVSLEVVGEAERATGAASGRTVGTVPAYSSTTPASLGGRIWLSSRRYLVGQNQT